MFVLLVALLAVFALRLSGVRRGPAVSGAHRTASGRSLAIDTGAPSLTLPVAGRVTSGFGWRAGSGDSPEFHTGVDLPAAEGETVRAAAAGVVEQVAEEPEGYGRYLLINHGDGWATLYAHNSRILVVQGQPVRRGQPVARAGRTGNATSSHVHFELRFRGEAVDPLPHFAGRLR